MRAVLVRRRLPRDEAAASAPTYPHPDPLPQAGEGTRRKRENRENTISPSKLHELQPLVSILVRSMDRPTLQRALDSVAAQDYPNVEVVVVAAGAAHRDLPDRCGAFPLRSCHHAAARSVPRRRTSRSKRRAATGSISSTMTTSCCRFTCRACAPRSTRTRRRAARALDQPRTSAPTARRSAARRGASSRGASSTPVSSVRTRAMFAGSLLDDGAYFDARFDILEDMDFFIQCARADAVPVRAGGDDALLRRCRRFRRGPRHQSRRRRGSSGVRSSFARSGRISRSAARRGASSAPSTRSG